VPERALSLCRSSIICCKYFPWASMRSCKLRWTYNHKFLISWSVLK
jgi:hypothetical protein